MVSVVLGMRIGVVCNRSIIASGVVACGSGRS